MFRLTEADEQRLVRAIANAERENRGEVRVHVEARCRTTDPVERARAVYFALKMNETRDDTGVLLYVAVKSKVCAVYAGAGIHGRAAPGFWKTVSAELAAGFRGGDPVKGLTQALGAIGELLRSQVPGRDAAGDELPDAISTGDGVKANR